MLGSTFADDNEAYLRGSRAAAVTAGIADAKVVVLASGFDGAGSCGLSGCSRSLTNPNLFGAASHRKLRRRAGEMTLLKLKPLAYEIGLV